MKTQTILIAKKSSNVHAWYNQYVGEVVTATKQQTEEGEIFLVVFHSENNHLKNISRNYISAYVETENAKVV